MINANKQDSETKEQQKEVGKVRRFFRYIKEKLSTKDRPTEETKQS